MGIKPQGERVVEKRECAVEQNEMVVCWQWPDREREKFSGGVAAWPDRKGGGGGGGLALHAATHVYPGSTVRRALGARRALPADWWAFQADLRASHCEPAGELAHSTRAAVPA